MQAFCYIMTVVALLQTVTVQFLKGTRFDKPTMLEKDDLNSGDEPTPKPNLLDRIKATNKSLVMDWISRIVFPIIFVIYTIAYSVQVQSAPPSYYVLYP